MLFTKRVVVGLIYSHFYLSVGASLFYYAGYVLLGGGQPKWAYLLMVFFSTFITYNVHRVLAKPKGENSHLPEKELWHQKNHRIVLATFLISILSLAVIYLFYLDCPSILFLAHLAIISIFYNLPDQHLPPWLRIRRIPLLKVILVGYVWGALSVFLPAIRLGYAIVSTHVFGLFLGHFLLIIAITIPFDFRDIKEDRQKGLVTLPLLVGIQTSKLVAITLLMIFGVIISGQMALTLLLLNMIIIIVLLAIASPKRSELYFSLGLDGIIFIYSLSVLWMRWNGI